MDNLFPKSDKEASNDENSINENVEIYSVSDIIILFENRGVENFLNAEADGVDLVDDNDIFEAQHQELFGSQLANTSDDEGSGGT